MVNAWPTENPFAAWQPNNLRLPATQINLPDAMTLASEAPGLTARSRLKPSTSGRARAMPCQNPARPGLIGGKCPVMVRQIVEIRAALEARG